MKKVLAMTVLALAILVLGTPTYAGKQKCKACNTNKLVDGAHGCALGKIVTTYPYMVMGPAKKNDGRKNDLKVIYKALYVYADRNCTEYLDWSGFSTMGCAGVAWQSGWPEERVVQ